MSLWQALVFGIVEGITEFLPVSSTGHLILTARILGLLQTEFLKSFEIAIQLGAIMAVVCLYWRALVLDSKIVRRIIAAFIPTAIIGLVFYKFIKKVLMGSDSVVLWSLFVGGMMIILFEIFYKRQPEHCLEVKRMTYRQAILIGVFQSIAMIPGVSRSAATILGGLAIGMDRKAIVEFSFLLAVPTMIAATGFDLAKNIDVFSFYQMRFLLVGFVASFIVAGLSIKFLLHFIKRHNFIVFGVYRMLIAGLFLVQTVL